MSEDEKLEDDDSDQEEDHDDDSVVDAEYEPGDSENDTSESSDTKLRKSVEEEGGDAELVGESGSVETGLSMSEDGKWEKDGDEHDHKIDDSVSDADYKPEDSESDSSESSDSQLRKIVKIKRRKMEFSDAQFLEAKEITERDPYNFQCENLEDIPPVTGLTEAESLAVQTGARSFVKNFANEAINPAGSIKKAMLAGQDLLRESKEDSDGGPDKKRRPRPKKKCP
ncbi:unnamed protein product [Clavelina lepadiformis]|uniref:Uncharacterized protein n=1 Tax=Clavelina lepadiformis TaxID=159417 RepID=A0ABP0GA94_CLALP